jgi:hypothetical protein
VQIVFEKVVCIVTNVFYKLNAYKCNSTKYYPSVADFPSAVQKVYLLFRHPKFYQLVHKDEELDHILSPLHPIHITTPHTSEPYTLPGGTSL